MPRKDLSGSKFNELRVIKFNGSKRTERTWLCECSCGETTVATTRDLTSGRRKSCGHTRKMRRKEEHKYDIVDDCAIVYTHKGEPFYVDLDELERVLLRTWYKHHDGYFYAKINNRQVSIQRYIMNPSEDEEVDHIHHDLFDNRKKHLRICSHLDNMKNQAIPKSNKSGIKGVFFDKRWKKWRAEIMVEHKRIYLGGFDNKEDAMEAREKAEEQFFGEYTYGYHETTRDTTE